MNGISDYVVAIDLGSSSMVGALGRKEGDKINILALEQKPVQSEIHRGLVHNIEDVAGSIREMIHTLSRSQAKPLGINHIYLGMNAAPLWTNETAVPSHPSGEELVNEKDLYELLDQVRDLIPEDKDIIQIFTQEYLVDGKFDLNPIGSMPRSLEGHYKVVLGKEVIMRNLEATFSRLRIENRTILGPVASAEAVLTSEEKSKGVVCLDFGAETTGVCVFKGGLVRHVAVLPFGGRNITNDLIQLNLDESEAENLKKLKGNALHYTEWERGEEDPAPSKEEIEFNELVVARIEEIVENIWAQICRSGIEPAKLLSGIVMTGGASQLAGLGTLLSRKTKMSVRMGDVTQRLRGDKAASFAHPKLAQCIGLLLAGEAGCCSVVEEPVKQKVEAPVSQNLFADEEKPSDSKKKSPKIKEPKAPKPPKPTKDRRSITEVLKSITNLFEETE